MDPTQYYVTTLSNAAMKIGPLVAFLVIGYFIFFKLPFLFFLRNMKKQKEQFPEPAKTVVPQEKYDVRDYERFRSTMKRLEAPKQEKKEEPREEKKKQAKSEQKKTEPKPAPKKDLSQTPEAALFDFKPGDVITKDELRKRYHEKLRQNHPDKVAALSPDFKKLADQKTKEINSAYARLKRDAA